MPHWEYFSHIMVTLCKEGVTDSIGELGHTSKYIYSAKPMEHNKWPLI